MRHSNPDFADARVSLLGELNVEVQLAMRGWHPVRLDTAQMAANADLIGVNKTHRVCIQVKTTEAEGHSHAAALGFGYATNYLSSNAPIFNGKESALIADVVVAVHYRAERSRYVVLPVAFAERLCRMHGDYWGSLPKRDGSKRSASFPLYLHFDGKPGAHAEHKSMCQANLTKFEDAWWVLSESIDKLHDPDAWPLLGASRQ